jgi:hypothetical protein
MSDWEKIAEIGVDSAMVWVGDPLYSMPPSDRHPFAGGWDGLVADLDDRSYETTGFAEFGVLGVAVQSGWGDGTYPVFVRRDPSSGRVVELRVAFDGLPPSLLAE